ncbi:hypothetical protein PVAND_009006 [Polypedilum vanderplanki]|uniref:Alpha 1,4-glycosyltransferase domain-containing protein n=1 Tax=Polypedilum vanderplanki TaxID=319348 RepID=A0A9J6CBR9_POLVA|nr:hypothetical protein PVAND_009006 [Polypedilum vanderplanki]
MIKNFEEKDVEFNEIKTEKSLDDPLVKVSLKLENIMTEEIEPKDDKNIFFIDSSHVLENPMPIINPRQLCSYESAAFTNPTLQIYIVFISLHQSMTLELTKPLNTLLSYKNVNIVYLKLSQFAKRTPAKDFIKSGKLQKSNFPVEHTSDVFRLLLLWKYGGFYLDSDMIVKKSVGILGENFACSDGERGIISNAFLNFNHTSGRELVEAFINDQLTNFDEKAWGYNGPQSISRVTTKWCKKLNTNKLKKKKNCNGFNIHPKKFCFPILPTYYEKIFQRNYTKVLTKRSKDAITVHMWNKLTKNIKIFKKEKNLYTTLAKNFCPRVYRAIDSEF